MHPVIFVHGIGDSAGAWKKSGLVIERSAPAYYISFKFPFGHPEKQARELKGFIEQALKESPSDKIDLVCHSMGGLVARKYLVDHPLDHKISKLVLIATPNLGSPGLLYDELCVLLIVLGLLSACCLKILWPLGLTLSGALWFIISLLRGNLLLSPANFSMRPGSRFLKELNSKPLPEDIKYVTILSRADDLISRLSDILLNIKEGDGAVPMESQKLSPKCVPNFHGLDHKEILIHRQHHDEPNAIEEIKEALEIE